MGERFQKLERQVTKLLHDLDKLKRENVTLRAESAKLNKELQARIDRAEQAEATSARFLRLQNEHKRFKEERTQIRREARALLRRVRALKKGGVAS